MILAVVMHASADSFNGVTIPTMLTLTTSLPAGRKPVIFVILHPILFVFWGKKSSRWPVIAITYLAIHVFSPRRLSQSRVCRNYR